MDVSLDRSELEIELIASAAAVPMLVVDYASIIQRFAGLSVEEIERRLADDDELMECLRLPRELAMSQEWVRLYGFPYDDRAPDLVTRHFTSSEYPDLRAAMTAQFLAPFRGITSIHSEHKAPTLAGDVVVRSHWKAPVRDGVPDYSRVVIVDLDVSDLRQTQRSLEEAIESKDRMIATISHELRNPLTAVVGFSSMLATDWEDLDDGLRREMAAQIANQVTDVSALLDDFLTTATGGSLRVADDIVRLDDAFDGLDLDEVDVHIDNGLVVRGDALRIRQIVRNLIRNAAAHGGQKRRLLAWPNGDTVAIQIRDDGPGVPDAVVDRLFEPFSHGADPGSLGLGLAVSKAFAEAMNGSLTYRRDRSWTVFELRLVTA